MLAIQIQGYHIYIYHYSTITVLYEGITFVLLYSMKAFGERCSRSSNGDLWLWLKDTMLRHVKISIVSSSDLV